MNNPLSFLTKKSSPVRPYRTIVQDSNDPGYVNKLLIATATTGVVRIEWVQARYGQIVPTNWSMVQLLQFMDAYIPLRYQVADAQNLIVKEAVEKDFEWLLLWEHDVIPLPDAMLRFNEYMREEKAPVVSGLYYTRSRPPEPLIYRGRGNSFYTDWQIGDVVECDGVPTGLLLIHCGVLRAMWEDAEPYQLGPVQVRRVFETPNRAWYNPETNFFNTVSGTSDIDWCTKVMKGNYLEKAGWSEYAKKEFPFILDTRICAKHINPNGEMFP